MVPDHRRHVDGGIYHFMLNPAVPLTASTYNYARRQDSTTRRISAASHMAFLNMWPTAASGRGSGTTSRGQPAHPVLILRARSARRRLQHFINPKRFARHQYRRQIRESPRGSTRRRHHHQRTVDHRSNGHFATFLKAHKNVVAYSRPHHYTQVL